MRLFFHSIYLNPYPEPEVMLFVFLDNVIPAIELFTDFLYNYPMKCQNTRPKETL